MTNSIKKLCLENEELIYCFLFSFIDPQNNLLCKELKGFSEFIWWDILQDLKYLNKIIESYGWKIVLEKSRRTKSQKWDSWKRVRVKTQNYTGFYMGDLLQSEALDLVSLDVHDFIIENIEEATSNVMGEIERSIESFMSWEKNINEVSFEKARKMLYRRAYSTVEITSIEDYSPESLWLFIWKDVFWEGIDFPYVHMSIIFENLWYLKFESLFVSIEHYYCIKKNMLYGCNMSITASFSKIIQQHEDINNWILDTIIDKKYKSIGIRQKRKWFLLEGTLEVSSKDATYHQLKKKYPHSTISTDIYDEKNEKFIVKRKKKLDEQE